MFLSNLSPVLWCLLRFPHKTWYSVLLQLFMSYLRYLCLLEYSGVHHILHCVFCFLLFVCVLCTQYIQFLGIVQYWFPLRFSLTFTYTMTPKWYIYYWHVYVLQEDVLFDLSPWHLHHICNVHVRTLLAI